jgi:hypothetical protein
MYPSSLVFYPETVFITAFPDKAIISAERQNRKGPQGQAYSSGVRDSALSLEVL